MLCNSIPVAYQSDLEVSDCLGRLPVHHASQAGSKEVLDLLIKHKVDISCAAKSNRMTPLHYAAKVTKWHNAF